MTSFFHPRPRLVRARRVHGADGPADAVLIRGDRVAAVGSGAELAGAAPEAEVLDLPGLTVTPGFTDAHVHLVEWALARRQPDLTDARSPDEAARLVASAVGDGEGWVRGRGWDPHRWNEVPHRRQLDDLLGDRPAVLQSHDMHSLWASSAALRAAGISAATGDPPGGRIERDADGPTGVVRDNAMPLLLAAAPTPTAAERRAALMDGQAALHRLGFTGVHTVEPDSLDLLEAVRGDGDLRIRVLQHLPLALLDDAIRLGVRSGFGGDWLRIGGVKMFLDGALGSRTALMREPYEGSDDRGVATLDPSDFRDAVRRGTAAGLAMTVHAIGDAAVDLALDVLGDPEVALDTALPHRIEHFQLVAPDRLERARRSGAARRVVASVQPAHLMTDWKAADRHWGSRARFAYAFVSLRKAGFTLALGSDAPVEPPDPRHGLFAAVARRDLAGEPEGGWNPHERIDPHIALAGYTDGAARAAGDPRQGSLAPGAFADLVAWDRDPLDVEPEALLELRAVATLVGGDVVWRDG